MDNFASRAEPAAIPAGSGSLVASFVFVDLVGFSKKSTSDQFAQKQVLNEILKRNLRLIPDRDYLIKDTGDGCWMGFVADPMHALYMVLGLFGACRPLAPDAGLSQLDLRVGINLGTVKQTLDSESRLNFVGDGINVAQRVMSFAQPGQITSSRSYFDAVASLDSTFPPLFTHVPSGSDKHGREHELYTIEPDLEVLAKLRAELSSAPPAPQPSAEPATGKRASSRGMLVAGAAVAGIAVVAVALWMTVLRPSASPAPGEKTASPASPSGAPAQSVPQSAKPATDAAAGSAAAVPAAASSAPASPGASSSPAASPAAASTAPGSPAAAPTAASSAATAAPSPATPVPVAAPPASGRAAAATTGKPRHPPGSLDAEFADDEPALPANPLTATPAGKGGLRTPPQGIRPSDLGITSDALLPGAPDRRGPPARGSIAPGGGEIRLQ